MNPSDLFPNGSKSFFAANPHLATGGQVPDAKPKCDKAPALVPADARKEAGIPSVTVRFTGFRVRPLDPDNFAGSIKDLLDGLRHASLIPGDEPWRIRLETEQVKVRSYKEERTEIIIDFLNQLARETL